MGQRGPAPKSDTQKTLEGNPGKRPVDPAADVEWAPIDPGPPEFLGAFARAEWDRLAPQLLGRQLLTEADRAAFAGYCQAIDDLHQAYATIAAEGATFQTEKGYVGPHPAVSQAERAWKRVLAFAVQFGLSPASRTRVRVPVPQVNPLDAMLGDETPPPPPPEASKPKGK